MISNSNQLWMPGFPGIHSIHPFLAWWIIDTTTFLRYTYCTFHLRGHGEFSMLFDDEILLKSLTQSTRSVLKNLFFHIPVSKVLDEMFFTHFYWFSSWNIFFSRIYNTMVCSHIVVVELVDWLVEKKKKRFYFTFLTLLRRHFWNLFV